MDGVAAWLGVGPLTEFLGEAAVIGVGPLRIGQSLGVHQPFHALVHGVEIDAATGEQLGQRLALYGRVGVQRKVNGLDIDVVGLADFFNTHGAEVTPRSDVVGEDLQDDRIGHRSCLSIRVR